MDLAREAAPPDGTFTLDLAGEALRALPVGRTLARIASERGRDPARLLVRLNGKVADDPASTFPRAGDVVAIDYRVRGA